MARESSSNPTAGRPPGPVVDLRCPQCEVKLRIPQQDVHKQIRCPACRAAFRLGDSLARTGTSAAAAPPLIARLTSPAAPIASARPEAPQVDARQELPAGAHPTDQPQWYVRTAEGEIYGPVEEDELREWIDEGRLDNQCQLLQTGWKQWQWADERFPELIFAGADDATSVGELFTPSKPRRPEPEIEFDQYGVPHVKQDDPFMRVENPFHIRAAGEEEEIEEVPDEQGLTGAIRKAISETRPYVAVMAVLAFFAGGGAIWYGATILSYAIELVLVPLILMGASLIIGGGLTIWAAFRLWQFSREVYWFTRDESHRRLRAILEAQRSFWQLASIVAITSVFLAVLTALLIRSLGAPVSMF